MLQTVCLFLFSPADRAGQPKEPNSRARATGRDTYAEYNDPAWGSPGAGKPDKESRSPCLACPNPATMTP